MESNIQKVLANTTKPIERVVQTYILPTIDHPVIATIVSWLVIVNIVYAIDDLPPSIHRAIHHPVSRFLLTFFGLYLTNRRFVLSLVVTATLTAVFYILKTFTEGFKLIWPQPDTHPGCVNTTVADLVAIFEGNRETLKKTMYASGVPLNIELTDENAPLISTYLINFGHNVTSSCKAPV